MTITALGNDEQQLLNLMRDLYWAKAPMLLKCHKVQFVKSRWPGSTESFANAVSGLVSKGFITINGDTICFTDAGLMGVGGP